jgi:hypothetical protein
VTEDDSLRSSEGFATAEEAVEATKDLLRDVRLVMLLGPYSGAIVGRRNAGGDEWTFF